MLENVVQKCLEECSRLKVKSVAFPSIGAGKLQYADQVVAKCLVRQAASYLDSHCGTSSASTTLQCIKFVIFQQSTYDAFQTEYQSLSKAPSVTSSSQKGGSVHKRGSLPQVQPVATRQATSYHGTGGIIASSNQGGIWFDVPHGIQLGILQGDISSERCDVIVNTTNADLQLVGGGVAGALLRKGGSSLQLLCTEAVRSGKRLKEGNVIMTRVEGVGDLKCKAIFHITFDRITRKKLENTFHMCLVEANKAQFCSIAFPAIGTGVHQFPSSEAAKAMVGALQRFLSKKPRHLKAIHMVLFQPEVYQEFSSAFKSMGESGGILGSLISKAKQFSQAVGLTLGFYDREEGGSDDEEPEELEGTFSDQSLDSEVILEFYGATDEAVNCAEKKMSELIDNLFVHETINETNISLLSDEVVHELKRAAKEYQVDIGIDRDELIHSVKIHGSRENVLLVKDKVRDALSNASQMESKRELAESLYRIIRWKRKCGDGNIEEYDEMTNYDIEQANKHNKPNFVFKSDKESFLIDFNAMTETDKYTREVSEVVRVDLSKTGKFVFLWKVKMIPLTI